MTQFTRPQLRLVIEGHEKDALRLLNLSRPYSTKQLKKAFRTKALKAHPDQGGSEDEFIKLKAAFDLLAKQAGISQTEIENFKSGLFPGTMRHSEYTTLEDDLARLEGGSPMERMVVQRIKDKIASGEEWETYGERTARVVDRSGYTPLLALVVAAGELTDYEQLSPKAIEVNPDTFDFGKLLSKLDKHKDLDVSKNKDYGSGKLVVTLFRYQPKFRGEKDSHMMAYVSIPQLRIDEWNEWTFTIEYNPNNGQLQTDASYNDENDLKSLR